MVLVMAWKKMVFVKIILGVKSAYIVILMRENAKNKKLEQANFGLNQKFDNVKREMKEKGKEN